MEKEYYCCGTCGCGESEGTTEETPKETTEETPKETTEETTEEAPKEE